MSLVPVSASNHSATPTGTMPSRPGGITTRTVSRGEEPAKITSLAYSLMTSRSRCLDTGFDRWESHPASWQSHLSDGEALAVRATMGVELNPRCFSRPRIARVALSPSITGI